MNINSIVIKKKPSIKWILFPIMLLISGSGFVVLYLRKRKVENNLSLIKKNYETEAMTQEVNSIIWWIVMTGAWGVVSITILVWTLI